MLKVPHSRRAFTLLELLISVSFLGVLTVLVASIFQQMLFVQADLLPAAQMQRLQLGFLSNRVVTLHRLSEKTIYASQADLLRQAPTLPISFSTAGMLTDQTYWSISSTYLAPPPLNSGDSALGGLGVVSSLVFLSQGRISGYFIMTKEGTKFTLAVYEANDTTLWRTFYVQYSSEDTPALTTVDSTHFNLSFPDGFHGLKRLRNNANVDDNLRLQLILPFYAP